MSHQHVHWPYVYHHSHRFQHKCYSQSNSRSNSRASTSSHSPSDTKRLVCCRALVSLLIFWATDRHVVAALREGSSWIHLQTDRACEPQPSRSCFHVSATTGAALVFPPFFLKVIIIKSSSYDKTNRQKEGFMELMSGFTGSSLPVVRTVKIETSGGWQMRLKSLKSVAEGKNDLIK